MQLHVLEEGESALLSKPLEASVKEVCRYESQDDDDDDALANFSSREGKKKKFVILL